MMRATLLTRRGLTLVEVVAAMTITGIVATVTIHSYGVAVEQARYDEARNTLLAIYWTEYQYLNGPGNGTTFYPATAGPSVVLRSCSPGSASYASCIQNWRDNLGMNVPDASAPVTYAVISYTRVSPVRPAFQAVAYYGSKSLFLYDDHQFEPASTWTRP